MIRVANTHQSLSFVISAAETMVYALKLFFFLLGSALLRGMRSHNTYVGVIYLSSMHAILLSNDLSQLC